MKMLTTIKRGLNTAGFKIAKNSPAIFAVAGVVGFGATAFLAYKARPKVEKIVEEIETARETNAPVDNVDIGMKLIKAVAAPVVVGVLSTVSIALSYNILTNRVGALASALTAAQASKQALETKVKDKYGAEAYNELVHKDTKVITGVDEDGNEVNSLEETLSDIDGAMGFWYKDSGWYHPDNHDYNMAWIDELIQKCDKKLFTRTRLSVNDVRSIFDTDKVRNGALLGWGQYTYFNIEKIVFNTYDEATQQIVPQILIKWSNPDYIWQTDTDSNDELDRW